MVAIILLELSGCEDILETKSIEGAVSLVPVVTSESSDVSGDEKTERKGRLSRTKTTKRSVDESVTARMKATVSFPHFLMQDEGICVVICGVLFEYPFCKHLAFGHAA